MSSLNFILAMTPRRSRESTPRADCLGDKFAPGTYQLRAERTSSRGTLAGSTGFSPMGFSPMSGPFGGLA